MMAVMKKHRSSLDKVQWSHVPDIFKETCADIWDDVIQMGARYGFRNAQATVIAPTGTIGLVMDCDTTGIEPDFSLIKLSKKSY